MPAELVPNQVSRGLVEALETLLEGSRQGHITGLAFAAVLRNRRYITNIAGTCARNLTHTRGMLEVLSDEIGTQIHGRDPGDTR